MPATPVRNQLKELHRIAGDREPIGFELVAQDGTPIDLTGGSLAFRAVNTSGGAVKINNATATIEDAENGRGNYAPGAEDVNTPGTYALYVLFTPSGGGAVKRFPPDGARWLLHLKAETDGS